MSEEQDPFEPMVRATLAELDQEPFEAMMRKMCFEAGQARAELRDRFAMAALTGMLADVDSHKYGSFPAEQRFTYFSMRAYAYADAMMKARGDD